jgi:hypothetical protein
VEGRRVQVFLRTPLFRGRYGEGEGRVLSDDVTEVTGTVLAEARTGLHLRVEGLSNERGALDGSPPFAEIVLPLSKIDHLVPFDEG